MAEARVSRREVVRAGDAAVEALRAQKRIQEETGKALVDMGAVVRETRKEMKRIEEENEWLRVKVGEMRLDLNNFVLCTATLWGRLRWIVRGDA